MLKINIAEHSYLKVSNKEAIYQKYTISNKLRVGSVGIVKVNCRTKVIGTFLFRRTVNYGASNVNVELEWSVYFPKTFL